MRNDKRLPDAELEVMQTIWSLGTQVTAAEVQQHADKDWKMTSVLTFLSACATRDFFPARRRDGKTCTRRSSAKRTTVSVRASAFCAGCAAAR